MEQNLSKKNWEQLPEDLQKKVLSALDLKDLKLNIGNVSKEFNKLVNKTLKENHEAKYSIQIPKAFKESTIFLNLEDMKLKEIEEVLENHYIQRLIFTNQFSSNPQYNNKEINNKNYFLFEVLKMKSVQNKVEVLDLSIYNPDLNNIEVELKEQNFPKIKKIILGDCHRAEPENLAKFLEKCPNLQEINLGLITLDLEKLQHKNIQKIKFQKKDNLKLFLQEKILNECNIISNSFNRFVCSENEKKSTELDLNKAKFVENFPYCKELVYEKTSCYLSLKNVLKRNAEENSSPKEISLNIQNDFGIKDIIYDNITTKTFSLNL